MRSYKSNTSHHCRLFSRFIHFTLWGVFPQPAYICTQSENAKHTELERAHWLR